MKNLIYLSAFVSGGAVMILEIMATRIIEPFLGNSIFTWIGVLSVMLASLSVGYFLGGKMADKEPRPTHVGWIFLFSGFLIASVPLFSSPILNFSQFFGIMYGPIFASLLLLSLPSISLAMISPYLIKLSAKKTSQIGAASGNIYALSTVGSILGTLLTGFCLIPNFGVKTTLFWLSIVLIANGALFFGRKGMLPFLIGLIINSAIPQPMNFPVSSNERLLYENHSLYQYLRVVDSGEVRFLSVGYAAQTGILLNSTDNLYGYQRYQKLIHFLNPNITKALFIGLGGGAMPSYMHRETDADITVVEIDPEVVRVAKKFFNFSEDGRMRVWIDDGRLFLTNSNEKYDYVAVDAYLNLIPPFHLTTLEFVDAVKKHLTPSGVVLVNIFSPVEGEKAGVFKALFKLYKNKFKNVYVFPLDNTNLAKKQNIIMIATDFDYGGREELLSAVKLCNDAETQELATHYYDGAINTDSYPLLTDDFSPLEILALGSLSE